MALKSYLTYKLLQEMAAPGRGVLKGTVSHLPIQYDKDDIIFLRQFDSKHWADAIHSRYDMLHDALVKLQKVRDKMAGLERTTAGIKIIEDGLADNVKKFIMGEPSGLSEEEKAVVSKRHTFKSGKSSLPLKPGITDAFWSEKTPKEKVSEKDVDEMAEDDAFEIVKNRTESIEDVIDMPKGKVEFKLGKLKKQRAFPYLTRLYHKLERTKGEPHVGSSGLEGVGEHGFDLSHPAVKKTEGEEEERTKKTTRGLNWVGKFSWERSLKGVSGTESSSSRAGYLAHSAYNHFGDLKDTPAYKRAEENGTLEWLPMDGKEGRLKVKDPKIDWLTESETKRIKEKCEKEAHDAGVKKCQKTFQEIKQEAKESVKAMISRGEVYAHPVPGISDEQRKYVLDNDKIIVPYIYLPHQKIVLPKEHEGEATVEKYVPILRKSSTLLRTGVQDFEPTSIEEDPESVETGERTGIVNVGPTPNRNEPAQAFADPRVAANFHYKEFLNSLMVNNYRIKSSSINGVVPDFIKGVMRGIGLGGTSPGVQRMIRNDPDKIMDFHNMVFNFILSKHLAAKKLQTEDGRVRLAQSLVSSYLQGTEFEVQRRARGKGGDVRGFGDISTGEEGVEFDPGTGAKIKSIGAKRKRGEAIFSKNLQQIRHSLSQMEKRISSQETVVPKTTRGESYEDTKTKLDKIMQNVKEKSEFFEVLKSGLIDKVKMTDKQADDIIKSWQEAEADPNRPDWTLDRIKEIFMGMLQSAEKGEEVQVARPEPVVAKPVFSKPVKGAPSVFARAKMEPTGKSPLLKRPISPQAPVTPQTGITPKEPEQQVDWQKLNGLKISERIEYFKNKIRG